MAELELKAQLREGIGRSVVRRMRRNGKIPAILYGKKKEPMSLELDAVELQKKAKGKLHENSLVDVKLDQKGETVTVLIKEVQRDAISGKILHLDLNEIDLTVKIKAEVPTEAVGEPKGVKEQGGVLEHILHEVEIECLPTHIPEHIAVDVTELMIGDSIHVRDLPVNPQVTILSDPELTVFAVAAPKVEEEPKPEAEGEAGPVEPELVAQKGKKEEVVEGEEAAKETKKEVKEGKKE